MLEERILKLEAELAKIVQQIAALRPVPEKLPIDLTKKEDDNGTPEEA